MLQQKLAEADKQKSHFEIVLKGQQTTASEMKKLNIELEKENSKIRNENHTMK
jgi:hypothetical protein